MTFCKKNSKKRSKKRSNVKSKKNQKGRGKTSEKKSVKKKMNEVKCLLIPHAGKAYAGDARERAFVEASKGRQVNDILYLAALHNPRGIQNKIYFFDGDETNQLNIPDNIWKEHSFRWVKDELKDWFPSAKIKVMIIPVNYHLDNALSKIEEWIYMTNNRFLIIGTTDLIHFGENYRMTDLEYPQQLSKISREENFVDAIKNANTQKVIKLYNDDNHLACGPIPIIMICSLAEKNKLIGKVVDYYDSHGIMRKNKIDKYSIDTEEVDMFVSYLSVVYYDTYKFNFPETIDINLGLGNVKSVISFKAISEANASEKVKSVDINKFLLPKWSYLRKSKAGVFVGTSKDNRTNCSYGRYQDDNTSTAQMILNASSDCPKDARERWKNPISKMNQPLNEITEVLDNLKYKVEFLEENTPKNPWKKIKASEYAFGGKNNKPFTSNNPYGLLLSFKTSKNNYAGATYLPYVWKESLPNANAEELLDQLSEKAAGENEKGAWRNDPNASVELYKSYKYEI